MDLGVDKIYAISLNRFTERRRNIANLQATLDIDIEIIDAIDNQDQLPLSSTFISDNMDKTFWDPSGWLTVGIICCAKSHRKAYKAFLDSDAQTALFLEDDAIITEHIHQYDFNSIRTELDTLDYGVCWYGKYYTGITTRDQLTENLYNAEYHHGGQYAGHAYVLNRKSAAWFYKNTEKIKYAADVRLEFSPFKQVTLNKSIFIQKHAEYYQLGKDIHEEFFHYTLEDATYCFEDKTNVSSSIAVKSKVRKDLGFGGKILNGWEFTF